jgi:ubiquinone/menaquinone biosynthesis C-methylase UbiE
LLAKKFPKVSFYGIDVSSSAIKEGKKFFLKNEIKNVFLQNISANQLKIFKDKSIDVIFSDASMIYINKTQIDKVLKEMFRIAKKSIILCEQHTEDFPFYNTKWIHNYKAVVERIIPKSRMNFIKISENIWAGDWEKYGYIIKIVL